MDWMYNSSTKVDPEEYLLGKPIDKGHFQEPSQENFMRSIKDEPASSHSQVELSRRIKEDPLTVIREKELEKRKILWKKSQIKNSDVKLVAVQVSNDDQGESESKSIHQLIVENLRQLPFKIDLEKFYVRLKERKKEKKLKKKKNDSSPDSQLSPDTRRTKRPEHKSFASRRSEDGRAAENHNYRRNNQRPRDRSPYKDGRARPRDGESKRPRPKSRSLSDDKRSSGNKIARSKPESNARSPSEDRRPSRNAKLRSRSPCENRQPASRDSRIKEPITVRRRTTPRRKNPRPRRISRSRRERSSS